MNEQLGFIGEARVFQTGPLTEDEVAFVERISEKQAANNYKSKFSAPTVYVDGGHREDVFGDSPELNRLSGLIEDALCQYLIESFPEIVESNIEIRRVGSWLNIGKIGKKMHTHDADVVAVLYLNDIDGEDGNTVLVNAVNPYLKCGSSLLQGKFRRYLRVRPREGQILIFPGYMEHSVEAYTGLSVRRTFGLDFTAFDSK